jgi:N-acetylglucosamine-6-phosphate deacetylase
VSRTVVRGGTLFTPGGRVLGDLVIDGSRIVALEPADPRRDPEAADPGADPEAVVIDATGVLVAPGLIDAQINGGFGIDLAATPERLWDLGALLPQHGVTAFTPTIITSPPAVVERALVALHDRPNGYIGAEPVGLHLEGPMLNPIRKGAHRAELLREPSLALVSGWAADTGVAIVTLASELPGALDAVRHLVAEGVVVSLGHTDATAQEVVAGVDAGARAVTHLFNAMAPFHHRAPGPVGVALADGRLTAGVIADGIHVDATAIAAAFAALGPERLMLVTDAVGALGLPAGTTRLGTDTVTIGSDGVRLPDGTLAGSDLSMPHAIANFVKFTGCTLQTAITCATATPAALLRLTGRGALAVGTRADLVLLDEDARVITTMVGGEVVHQQAP